MSLILRNWEPLNLLREFDDSFFNRESSVPWSPKVNISENKTGYVITAELPGVKKEDINIDLAHNTLTLKGEKKFEKKDEEGGYLRIESGYGKFSRSFNISDDVDINKADASFKDGILKVELKKKEETKPDQVKLEIK